MDKLTKLPASPLSSVPAIPCKSIRRINMGVAELDIKQRLVQELEKLSPEKLGDVLDFVVFLRSRAAWEKIHIPVRFLPASHLDGLVDLVAWGGDALADFGSTYNIVAFTTQSLSYVQSQHLIQIRLKRLRHRLR